MNRMFLLLLVLLTQVVNAEEGFPPSCQPISVLKETILLTTKKPTMVLIHNASSNDLWITHPVSDPSASAGWSSRLEANQWSALALDKDAFELSCIESKPGHEQQVPCAGLLALCEWGTMKIPANSGGTFWAGENMGLSALIEYLGGRGFVALSASTK